MDTAAKPEAKKAGVPTQLGDWRLVRYIPGEHAHFLYASGTRTFSLFLTETKNSRPLQTQMGWKIVHLTSILTAFIHRDSHNPEHTAIVFKHQTQRRMIMGRLSEAELVSLAKPLR